MNRIVVSFVIVGFALYSALFGAEPGEGAKSMTLEISSTSFPADGSIPNKFTCDGQDVSPALTWSGAPQGTKAFALIVDDPDAPSGTWNHWLTWNLPAHAQHLAEGFPKSPQLGDGTRQGQNDFHKIGYNGPCPPPGKPHRYYFKLFALDAPLQLKPGADRKELDSAMKSHVIAQTDFMARYGR